MAKPPYTFDVFVSYRWVEPDQNWVRDKLVPALKSAGLKVCLDVEDFVPGRDLILEMNRAGSASRHALCILSPDYFNGNRMVGFESLMARRADPSGMESKLIPLIYRKVALPEWLRGLIPIDWTEREHHPREWRKLLKTLAAPKPDAPEPGLALQLSEPKDDVAGPSQVVERCRVLGEIFRPGRDRFDQLAWLRDADSITMDVWLHAGLPETDDLRAVIGLWELAINGRAESAAEWLAASVGNWRMAECLFTPLRERTRRILRALGLAENEPTKSLELPPSTDRSARVVPTRFVAVIR